MSTGWQAFRLSFVLFLIPFGFAFDTSLLGQGPVLTILFAFLSLLYSTAGWAVALVGFLRYPLSMLTRILFAAASIAIILYPTLSPGWTVSMVALGILTVWAGVLSPRLKRV